jgi:hypothetical protein
VLKRASLPPGGDTGGFFNDSAVDFFGVHTSGTGSHLLFRLACAVLETMNISIVDIFRRKQRETNCFLHFF